MSTRLYPGSGVVSADNTSRLFPGSGIIQDTLATGNKTITLSLVDHLGNAASNLTSIKWAWFDEVKPSLLTTPTDQGSAETTDGSGQIQIELPNTTLTSGQTGYLMLTDSDGLITTNHLQAGGPVVVD